MKRSGSKANKTADKKKGKRTAGKEKGENRVQQMKTRYEDKMVDYMGTEESYLFNQTPVTKSKKDQNKGVKAKKDKKQFSEFIREEDDDQFDLMQKRVKHNKLEPKDEMEFEQYDDDLESYFITNQAALN